MNHPLRLAVGVAFGGVLFTPSAFAADASAGQQVYQHACVACHGTNGKGTLPGTPDFRQPGGVLSQPDNVLLDRIEHGYQAPGSPMAMPPKGGDASLTDQDVKNVLAYLHKAFGTNGDAAAGSVPPADENKGSSGTRGGGMMGRGMMGGGMMHGGMMNR